ncbi:MAG: hypothetical protein J5857_12170 [Treponema sp.]|nr:hypothetical protein [Treponema sp.]
MKKIISIAVTVFSIATLFLAVSCHDPIFYMISQEVVQEEGLQGDIYSMVRFGDYLYASNGRIYKKTASPSSTTGRQNGQWSESSRSGIGSNEFVFFLATDNSNIYAQTYEFAADNDKSLNLPAAIRLYASNNGSTWTQINIFSITDYGSASDSYATQGGRIFDNKAVNASERHAYASLLKNGETTPKIFTLNGTNTPTHNSSASGDSLGAAGDYFWTTAAICKANNGKYYFSHNSKTLYYGNSISATDHVDLDCDDIQSIAATSDYLLLGTTKGIKRVRLGADGVPESHTTDFANNAQSLVTGIVPMVFVLDPTKPEGQTDEYASMTVAGSLSSSADTFEENGLYAYYPSRGVWNRDGE